MGSPPEKGEKKKKKKNLVLSLGSPPEKGGKKPGEKRPILPQKKQSPIPPRKTLRGTPTHGPTDPLSEFILVRIQF
jgi:hypothetical protein